MAGLKKKVNFNRVRKLIIDKRLVKLRKESFNIIDGIEQRTLKGQDYKLRLFDGYSRSYSAFKAKPNKNKKSRGTGVNLTYTGRMLESMTTKKIKNGLRFTFMSSSELKKAGWNQKTRRFFGTDKKQRARIRKVLSKL